MPNVLKGVNVIAVPSEVNVNKFDALFLSAKLQEGSDPKNIKNLSVDISKNTDIVSLEDFKIFEKVFNKAVEELKKLTQSIDPQGNLSALQKESKSKVKKEIKPRKKNSKPKTKKK